MAAPTLIGYYEPSSNWASVADATSLVTSSFSVLANDRLVVVAVSEIGFDDVDSPPVGGSLTWTLAEDPTPAIEGNDVDIKAWTATVDSGKSMTVTLTSTGDTSNPRAWGFVVIHYRSSDGFGAAESAIEGAGGPSLAITTTQANSALVVAAGDFNAIDGATRTWRTASVTPTAGNGLEKTYYRNSVAYTVYAAVYNDVGAVGAKTVGLSAPIGQRYGIVAIEVKGGGGTSVNASVTGQSLTASVGTVTTKLAYGVSVTGAAATASVGTVSTSLIVTNGFDIEIGNLYQVYAAIGPVEVATINTTAAFAATQPFSYLDWVVGSVASSNSVTGIALTASVGTVTVASAGNVSVAAASNLITASAGTVSVTTQQRVSVTGQALVVSGGTVSVSAGGGVSAGLNGNLLTVSVGDVSVSGATIVLPIGEELSISTEGADAGAGVTIEVAVGGQQVSVAVGDVTVAIGTAVDAEVTGFEMTVSVGDVTLDFGCVVEVSGLQLEVGLGQAYNTNWGPATDRPVEIWTEVSRVA